jgi:isocitrate dehydrogenase
MGWVEAANQIIQAMEKTIQDKIVTYDLARLMKNAQKVSCSKFGEELVKRMG